MEALNLLRSPYAQELPLDLIDDSVPNAKQDAERGGAHLILDVLQQRTYLLDADIVTAVQQERQHVGVSDITKCRPIFSKCDHNYIGLEVEVNTHCNLRCRFCPVSTNPHPQQLMRWEHYVHIMTKAKEYGIREISLNHYSEPTLSPLLPDMITFATEIGLSVTLYSNGTNLTPKLVRNIALCRENLNIVINLPESNRHRYHITTGIDLFQKVVTNIHYASMYLPLEIVVNCASKDILDELQMVFPSLVIKAWETDDRAGELGSCKFAPQNQHSGLLNGCPLALRYLNISVDGDVFLCPQDFRKIYKMGSLLCMSLKEIVEGERAQQLRKWIFGIENAPENMICRRCRWTQSKTAKLSIGAALGPSDLAVYGDIVRSGDILRVFSSDPSILYANCSRGATR